MAEMPAFDWICNRLERDTSLDLLEARGTLRLALRAAGLEAGSARLEQMTAVLQSELVTELAVRGVEDPEDVCARLAAGLEGQVAGLVAGAGAAEPLETMFERLGESF